MRECLVCWFQPMAPQAGPSAARAARPSASTQTPANPAFWDRPGGIRSLARGSGTRRSLYRVAMLSPTLASDASASMEEPDCGKCLAPDEGRTPLDEARANKRREASGAPGASRDSHIRQRGRGRSPRRTKGRQPRIESLLPPGREGFPFRVLSLGGRPLGTPCRFVA